MSRKTSDPCLEMTASYSAVCCPSKRGQPNSRQSVRRGGFILPLGAALLLALAAGVRAQTWEIPEGRLQLVIRSDVGTSELQIRQRLVAAIKDTESVSVPTLEVDPLTSEAYASLIAVERGTFIALELVAGAEVLRPLPGSNRTWQIVLEHPFSFLDGARLTFADNRLVELKSAPRTVADASLRYFAPGVYVLRLDDDDLPKSIELTVSDEGQKGGVVDLQWPQQARFYLATMEDFSGEVDELFDALRGPATADHPATQILKSRVSGLAWVSFTPVESTARVSVTDSTLEISLPTPRNSKPRQAWLLFPLARDSVTERRLAALNAAGEDVAAGLSRHLSSQLAPSGPTAPASSVEPRWLKISWDSVRHEFRRTLPLVDVPTPQRLLRAGSSVASLVVYEAENDQGQHQALLINGNYLNRLFVQIHFPPQDGKHTN